MAVHLKGSPITGPVIVEAGTQLNVPAWASYKQQQREAIITVGAGAFGTLPGTASAACTLFEQECLEETWPRPTGANVPSF